MRSWLAAAGAISTSRPPGLNEVSNSGRRERLDDGKFTSAVGSVTEMIRFIETALDTSQPLYVETTTRLLPYLKITGPMPITIDNKNVVYGKMECFIKAPPM